MGLNRLRSSKVWLPCTGMPSAPRRGCYGSRGYSAIHAMGQQLCWVGSGVSRSGRHARLHRLSIRHRLPACAHCRSTHKVKSVTIMVLVLNGELTLSSQNSMSPVCQCKAADNVPQWRRGPRIVAGCRVCRTHRADGPCKKLCCGLGSCPEAGPCIFCAAIAA